MEDYNHISKMEKLFDEAKHRQTVLEMAIADYKNFQPSIQKLEKYYSSKQWKDDFAADEREEIPSHIKRGVLSEDGIYDLLERNKEIMDMLDNLDEEKEDSQNHSMTYLEVVRKAQAYAKKRGEYGNSSVTLYPCETWLNGDQINLWNYWQGHQYKDLDKGVDILLVGQDWGNPQKDPLTFKKIEDIQSGKRDSFLIDHASTTDKNMEELFKCFGCDIEKVNPGLRLFFTNYSLGYRYGNETGGMTKALLLKDAEFFDDLVHAIKPKIIICLGKITYEAVTGKVTKGFTDKLKQGIPWSTPYPGLEDIMVYGVAHCGSLGTNNAGGMKNMMKAWKEIARESGLHSSFH